MNWLIYISGGFFFVIFFVKFFTSEDKEMKYVIFLNAISLWVGICYKFLS